MRSLSKLEVWINFLPLQVLLTVTVHRSAYIRSHCECIFRASQGKRMRGKAILSFTLLWVQGTLSTSTTESHYCSMSLPTVLSQTLCVIGVEKIKQNKTKNTCHVEPTLYIGLLKGRLSEHWICIKYLRRISVTFVEGSCISQIDCSVILDARSFLLIFT